MKKLLIFLIPFLFILPHLAYASITATPEVSPTSTASKSADTSIIDQQINKLKDQIASRVAQLKLVEKRGVIGTVTEVSGNQLTLNDIQGNTRIITVDELTKFNSPDSKSFGLSDITKGTTIGVLGLYNKEARQLLARDINPVAFPQIISGIVAAVDKQNYLIHVATIDIPDVPTDIETFTKTYVYTAADGEKKAGFSKIAQGERITIIGFYDKNKKTHILASRIILLPEVTVNPKITLPNANQSESSPSATITLPPSVGSGKKLYPLPAK